MHPLLTLLSKPGSVARGAAVLIVSVAALTCSGCLVKKPVEQHYYDEHIQPIFNSFCINNTSPCHRVDPATGVALGNLDLTSFDNVQKRRDVLRIYGSYPTALRSSRRCPIPRSRSDSRARRTRARSCTRAASRSRPAPTRPRS